tara:strand:+ start:1552 stop:2523 length:972 start_codon:yes stop_codon:yes gene_type:complete
MTENSAEIVVAGGGSFGTAVAQQASMSGQKITLFCRDPETRDAINNEHRNIRYFPNTRLSDNLTATCDPGAMTGASQLFVAIPSGSIRSTFEALAGDLQELEHIVLLSKGLCDVHDTFDAFFSELLPHTSISSLKGPTFARQLLLGVSSGMTLGTSDEGAITEISSLFEKSCVQLDYHASARDVEHVSALKNIYAIALGALNAIDDSENLTFLGTTKILQEMRLVLRSLECDEGILWKHCGAGDLLMTSLSNQSRNRTLGYFLGKDFDLRLDDNPIVLEGVKSLRYFSNEAAGSTFPIIDITTKLVSKEISANEFFDRFVSYA